MEERDYFKKQIDILGKVLEKLLTQLIGKKSNSTGATGVEITNQVLKSELDMDILDLICLPKDKLIDYLKNKKQLSNHNIELIADIVIASIATDSKTNFTDKNNKLNLLEKCLLVYEYIQANDKIYSLERNRKIIELQQLITTIRS